VKSVVTRCVSSVGALALSWFTLAAVGALPSVAGAEPRMEQRGQSEASRSASGESPQKGSSPLQFDLGASLRAGAASPCQRTASDVVECAAGPEVAVGPIVGGDGE